MTITLNAAQAITERARARHDYEVDTVGSTRASRFVSELRAVDGIVLRTSHPDPPATKRDGRRSHDCAHRPRRHQW